MEHRDHFDLACDLIGSATQEIRRMEDADKKSILKDLNFAIAELLGMRDAIAEMPDGKVPFSSIYGGEGAERGKSFHFVCEDRRAKGK